MYDSREQVLVLHQGGRRRKEIIEKRELQEHHRLTGKKKCSIKSRKRLCKLVGILCMVIGSVSLALAVQVLAASGNWKGRSLMEDAGAIEEVDIWGADNGGQEIPQGGMVSANVAVSPNIESEISDEPLIAIDAGHGGVDEGCAVDAVWEKDVNLAIAVLVKDKLQAMGYRVLMIREDDSYVAKEDRAKLANECGADAYISIHQNSSEDKTVKGIEVWYDGEDTDRDNKRLAQLVGQQTVKRTEAVERELKEDSELHVICQTVMPACLIETGFLTNDEEREKLTAEEYQVQAAEGIAQGIDYYFHPKTMYLTFDDGPTEENTSRVLDVLKERNIKATFFVVGENVRKHPEVAKRIVEEGHTIGIHCDNHAYDVVYESVDSYLQDFETAYETVKEVTGVEVKLFRFPGGSVNAYNGEIREAIIEEMTNQGFIYFDWNSSLEDAVRKSTPEQLIANGVETTLGRKKVVMLAHDVVYNTGICLGDLLDRLPEYRMEALTEDVEPVQF